MLDKSLFRYTNSKKINFLGVLNNPGPLALSAGEGAAQLIDIYAIVIGGGLV